METTSPREKAESIVVRAMGRVEEQYLAAIGQEEGNQSRLDLIDRYTAALATLSTALRDVSTEVPC